MSDVARIRTQLSTAADGSPDALSRRRFLQFALAGAAVAGTGVGVGFRSAFGSTPLGSDDRVLVLIELLGGNDGLNTVAPVDSGHYHDLRRGIAISPAEGLRIDGGLAFHPSLSHIKDRFDAGDVAVVQGVGYADSTLSHFDSMAMWMGGEHGLVPGRRPETGWIGRYLDGLGAGRSPVEAVAFDTAIPLHMRGSEASAVTLGIGPLPDFGTDRSTGYQRMYETVRRMDGATSPLGPWADELAAAGSAALDLATELRPAYARPHTGWGFATEMVQAARLINVDIGVRLLTVQLAGFDTHQRHEWEHGVALGNLDTGVQRFFEELDARFADRVTVMTFSEFGRRPQKNASDGTDHGAASLSLVVGQPVVGGLYGEYPLLDALDRRGNLVPRVDFRDLYGTVAEAWLGADGSAIVGGRYEGLGLFGAVPNTSTTNGVRAVAPVAPVAQSPQPSSPAGESSGDGYVVLSSDGAVQQFGHLRSHGSAGAGAVAVRTHPLVDGYWIAEARGVVTAYGLAPDHGSVVALDLASAIVDMAPSADGRGYWLASEDGGLFALGAAPFHGSAAALSLAAPVSGMAARPAGDGYWLCGRDGGVFAFGSAPFHGSVAHLDLVEPIVTMAVHSSGDGYWLLTADGGVFAFGAAPFHGSLAGVNLAAPIVDMATTPTGDGYWLLGGDGGVFTFGDASFHGAPRQVSDRTVSVSIAS